MTEADRLRAAMQATEHAEWGRFDVEAIMRDGRRLRRRRWAVQGGTIVLAIVLVVGVAVAWDRPRPPEPASPPDPAPSATATASTDATPAAALTPPPVIGEVVRTGIWYGDEERVFYVVPVSVPRAPEVTIGLGAGRRTPTGRLILDFLVNDVEGADRRPGFHQIGYEPSGEVLPDDPVPTFGYFVGPAARIDGTAGGQTVTARLARWSADADVVIFWFPPEALRPGQRLDGIRAWDARDRRLR
ncbi:hypothetical protein ABT008_22245 [Micromonospora sp. NPDC002389]|uniref:hypothetical protein n=1 Tax=Micromonospora sp. NPDC002389 TaxID=3154272 RepID=UPI0033319A27